MQSLGVMRLLAVALILGAAVLSGTRGAAAAALSVPPCPKQTVSAMPADLNLGKPLVRPTLTAKEALAIARTAGIGGVKQPYTLIYGSWAYQPDEPWNRTDVWEIRISKGKFPNPGGHDPLSRCQAPRTFHHEIIVIGDKARKYLQATTY